MHLLLEEFKNFSQVMLIHSLCHTINKS